MQINRGGLVLFFGVMALLSLSLEPDDGLAEVAVDNLFGWGVLGLAVWFGLGRLLSRLWTSSRGHAA